MSSLALYVFAKSYELNNFLRGRYQAAIISIDDDKVKNISKDEGNVYWKNTSKEF